MALVGLSCHHCFSVRDETGASCPPLPSSAQGPRWRGHPFAGSLQGLWSVPMQGGLVAYPPPRAGVGTAEPDMVFAPAFPCTDGWGWRVAPSPGLTWLVLEHLMAMPTHGGEDSRIGHTVPYPYGNFARTGVVSAVGLPGSSSITLRPRRHQTSRWLHVLFGFSKTAFGSLGLETKQQLQKF